MMPVPPGSTLFPYTTLFRSPFALAAAVEGDFDPALEQPKGLKAKAPLAKAARSEEHTSELQSRQYLVCRLLLEKKTDRQCHTRRPRRRAEERSPAPRAHRRPCISTRRSRAGGRHPRRALRCFS